MLAKPPRLDGSVWRRRNSMDAKLLEQAQQRQIRNGRSGDHMLGKYKQTEGQAPLRRHSIRPTTSSSSKPSSPRNHKLRQAPQHAQQAEKQDLFFVSITQQPPQLAQRDIPGCRRPSLRPHTTQQNSDQELLGLWSINSPIRVRKSSTGAEHTETANSMLEARENPTDEVHSNDPFKGSEKSVDELRFKLTEREQALAAHQARQLAAHRRKKQLDDNKLRKEKQKGAHRERKTKIVLQAKATHEKKQQQKTQETALLKSAAARRQVMQAQLQREEDQLLKQSRNNMKVHKHQQQLHQHQVQQQELLRQTADAEAIKKQEASQRKQQQQVHIEQLMRARSVMHTIHQDDLM